MKEINFHNKKFALIDNSQTGEVSLETTFEYQQEGELVTAEYFGGSIKYGKILAYLKENKLDMLYQCITTDNELKAGKAIAKVELTQNGKIKLSLDWEWINGDLTKGKSEYIEI